MELENPRSRRLCNCGREAVEKVAGPRSPNFGLRYFCCDRFVFFGKKKSYCRFFEWIDPPRITQEEKKQARAAKLMVEDVLDKITALKPANSIESPVRDPNAFDEQQGKKDNVELEKRSALPCSQITQDVTKAAVESSFGAQSHADHRQDVHIEDAQFLRAQMSNGQVEEFSGAGQQDSSPTHGINCKADKSNLDDTFQPITQVGQHVNSYEVSDEGLTSNFINLQSGTNSHDISETPNCLCMRAALLKTVKSRGPNQGLRYWVCSNSRPFYVKKKAAAKDGEESCKFFRWIDPPCITQEDKKQARAAKFPRTEGAFDKNTAFKPAITIESPIRDSNTFEQQQVKKDNALHSQIPQDVTNAVVESSFGAQNSAHYRQNVYIGDQMLREQTGNGQLKDLSGAGQEHGSPTHGINSKTEMSNFKDTLKPITQIGQDVNFHEVQDEGLTANRVNLQICKNFHDISETLNCFCMRAAILRTVKSRGPNQGLRFWVCSSFRPFYVKKKEVAKDGEESCKFFRWIDTPSE